MKTILFFILFSTICAGCTVYRSDERGQFESDYASQLAAGSAFALKSCAKQSKLENWFYGEFPSQSYELVVAQSDLEIWKSHIKSLGKTSVEIKAIQKEAQTSQVCIYTFSSEAVWELHKEQFIFELENSVMSLQ